MDIRRTREIIRTLVDGVDPTTGEVLPEESVYNSPQVICTLFTMLEATLERSAEIASPFSQNLGRYNQGEAGWGCVGR